MRLALAQLDVESGAVERNRRRALDAVGAAADRGADLVALPEIFNVGYFAFDAYARAAEPLDGPTLSAIADAAADRDVAVLAGSIVEDLAETEGVQTPADEGLANTSVLFDRDGIRRTVYRKHHLFGYESAEAELLVPGESLGVASLDGATVGMTTCYDLRFPELYRELAERGADLIVVPSAWPYPPGRTLEAPPAGPRGREPTVRRGRQRLGVGRRRHVARTVDGVRPVGDRAREHGRRARPRGDGRRPRPGGSGPRGVPGVARSAALTAHSAYENAYPRRRCTTGP